MQNKAAYMFLLLALGTMPAAGSVYAADITPRQVEEAEQKAKARQMELKKLQAQSIKLSLELAKMNKRMIAAAKQLQKDEDKTTKMENELQLLEAKLKTAEEQFNREYTKLAQTLASLQSLALHPTEALFAHPSSPVDVIRSAMLLRGSVPYLDNRAAKIKEDLEDIAARKKAVEKKLQALSEQKSSLLKQQQSLKKMAAQKNSMRKKLEGESRKTQEEARQLASKATDLRELMEKLEHDKEIRRRRQEEIRRAAREREIEERRRLEEEQRRRLESGEGSGLRTEDGELYQAEESEMIDLIPENAKKSVTNFADARGSLTRPARGPIITSYGQELSKGVNSKGIVIKTRENAQVIAPYDGSVIFSGPFKGYGNLIIIDHGRGYMSLLAGMDSVDTETGQMVLAGEPVGIMPDSDSAKLYMEIRKDKRPVNPVSWLGN